MNFASTALVSSVTIIRTLGLLLIACLLLVLKHCQIAGAVGNRRRRRQGVMGPFIGSARRTNRAKRCGLAIASRPDGSAQFARDVTPRELSPGQSPSLAPRDRCSARRSGGRR